MFEFLFFVTAFLSEIAGTIGGFGSSVFFVPLAGLFFNIHTVLALTSILHVFSNSSKLLLFRRHIDFRLVLLMGIPSILLVIVGAYLSTQLDVQYVELAMSIFLIAFSLLLYLFPHIALPPSKPNAVIGGGIAGFLAGLIGTGGAIRGLVLAAFNLEKGIFIATSAAIDFGVDISRMVIYLNHSSLELKYFFYIPGLIIIAFAGSWVGKWLLERIPQEKFRKLVLVLIFLIGITTLVQYARAVTPKNLNPAQVVNYKR
ncbi:sulfite exporter TauE/SafE family protein [Chlorobium sp. BLA1]|uniref:sulfite exporter TauE/SafE family protein n=1 Tax=Candidatus Chlorobium masyuteum TaxID=2716876 RepID=UPI00141F962F|nr:sulfite exporter TauE/SafE family protein [Candidatus Chlorobium masyuteum]NHQ59673.1 sulfite exporter TauE/SafE family protein [Candidatus Chlorobium masyuteum]